MTTPLDGRPLFFIIDEHSPPYIMRTPSGHDHPLSDDDTIELYSDNENVPNSQSPESSPERPPPQNRLQRMNAMIASTIMRLLLFADKPVPASSTPHQEAAPPPAKSTEPTP